MNIIKVFHKLCCRKLMSPRLLTRKRNGSADNKFQFGAYFGLSVKNQVVEYDETGAVDFFLGRVYNIR